MADESQMCDTESSDELDEPQVHATENSEESQGSPTGKRDKPQVADSVTAEKSDLRKRQAADAQECANKNYMENDLQVIL